MSWWISLVDSAGEYIDTDSSRTEGGTLCVGGTSEAVLNVTYNYGCKFNFRLLNLLPPKVAIVLIEHKIEQLKDDIDSDYWNPTDGNVKRALKTLRDFAKYTIDNNIDCAFRVN